MAFETPCQTKGARYHTTITDNKITISVDLPWSLNLSLVGASILENILHNSLELALAPLWVDHFYHSDPPIA